MDLDLMRELSVKTDSKILLLILDGLGGLPLDPSGPTELEAADSPNLDTLAARSDLGLSLPVAAGVSPGSGPGHLALFGYDPLRYVVGRGVLSALGVGFELTENDLAARLNFATLDEAGRISDRRAGRIRAYGGSNWSPPAGGAEAGRGLGAERREIGRRNGSRRGKASIRPEEARSGVHHAGRDPGADRRSDHPMGCHTCRQQQRPCSWDRARRRWPPEPRQ